MTAVETSEINRNFIHKNWGIDSLYADLSDIPARLSFDAVVAINVLEHVYDIANFLASLSKMLAKNGTLFISTSNASSLEAAMLRGW